MTRSTTPQEDMLIASIKEHLYVSTQPTLLKGKIVYFAKLPVGEGRFLYYWTEDEPPSY